MTEYNLGVLQVVAPYAALIATLVTSVITVCLSAWLAHRGEVCKTIELRFVETFESAIAGLSEAADLHVNVRILLETATSKEALALKLRVLAQESQMILDSSKKTDDALYKLDLYFPNAGQDQYDSRKMMSAFFKLFDYVISIDRLMVVENRTTISDEEYGGYQQLEPLASSALATYVNFLRSRREYFAMCFSAWMKTNVSYVKGLFKTVAQSR